MLKILFTFATKQAILLRRSSVLRAFPFSEGSLAKLTQNINFSRNFSGAVSVLCHAEILSGLVSGDAVVEEQDVVGGHDVVVELPLVVGLRVGLGGAENLSAGGPLLHGDELVGYLDVFWWVFRGKIESVSRIDVYG
jgi:hypothetical protein